MLRKVIVIGAIDDAGTSLLKDRSDIEYEVVVDVSEENLCRVVHDAHGLLVRTATISCLLYTSPSPRDKRQSRMPSSA